MAPSATVTLRYGCYDLVLITDKEGYAQLFFMDKMTESGVIKDSRYTCTPYLNNEGLPVKDHCYCKGKAA